MSLGSSIPIKTMVNCDLLALDTQKCFTHHIIRVFTRRLASGGVLTIAIVIEQQAMVSRNFCGGNTVVIGEGMTQVPLLH